MLVIKRFIIPVLIISFMVTGCGDRKAGPDLSKSRQGPRQKWEKRWKFSLLQPIVSDKLKFSDEYIDLGIAMTPIEINIALRNVTRQPINIDWEQVYFLSPDEKKMRIIHSGVLYPKRGEPQKPTLIPPGMTHYDALIPVDNIQDVSTKKRWEKLNLFPGKDPMIYDGKQWALHLPIDIQGEIHEYHFVFLNKINPPK